MQIRWGLDASAKSQGRDECVCWDEELTINGHMLITGASGTGKSHLIRSIANQLTSTTNHPLRIHLFDVHGDLKIPGCSSVLFSEQTDYGINPLKIDADPHRGGVRRRVQNVLNIINKTARQLGVRQHAVMRAILMDLYAANGFYADQPASWSLEDGVTRKYPKKFPTLFDAQRFAYFKLKSLYLGADNEAAAALEKLNAKIRTLNQKRTQASKSASEAALLETEIKKLGEEATRLYSEYISQIKTGRELDEVLRYDSKDTLKSVHERIESLNSIGIFKASPPPFDPNQTVWHYDLTSLDLDERKLFVFFRLDELFREAYRRGPQKQITDVLVLDEAHIYQDDDPENPINTISKEARKFGQALIAASQSPTHFPDDFLSSVATKIVLGIDEMYWDNAARKLRLDQKALKWIQPQKRLLVQQKQKSGGSADWRWVLIPESRHFNQSAA